MIHRNKTQSIYNGYCRKQPDSSAQYPAQNEAMQLYINSHLKIRTTFLKVEYIATISYQEAVTKSTSCYHGVKGELAVTKEVHVEVQQFHQKDSRRSAI